MQLPEHPHGREEEWAGEGDSKGVRLHVQHAHGHRAGHGELDGEAVVTTLGADREAGVEANRGEEREDQDRY